ncbi:predicted protein [Naegleria gruberi]|uniref:Predicted protein n=1 Tax=Naegleria gruberi TaxID=5762 RepID=D2VFN0_NAEGR|nr:uncharacterized protein NAEGRDRAFT_33662 [Naegleria gruberi]EFC44385.1 predicted protein [Naegleria gruberi]|eukprot:XP_002677129.1 predicted protein [Naegleria gruberi strain NEG-M]
MGQNQGSPSSGQLINIPSLSKDLLDKLAHQTHYDKKEIKQLHTQFYSEVPNGAIPKEDFCQLTELMGIKDPFITSLVFNAFDRNCDSSISFDEFLISMSIMTRGNADEKLEFAFKLYDLNHDGYILKSEMTRIVTALYQMLGDLLTLQGDFDKPSKLVDKIFEEMDTNRDGKLTFEEYKIGAKKCPEIVNGLALF